MEDVALGFVTVALVCSFGDEMGDGSCFVGEDSDVKRGPAFNCLLFESLWCDGEEMLDQSDMLRNFILLWLEQDCTVKHQFICVELAKYQGSKHNALFNASQDPTVE